jgi:hypothetical protein
MTLAAGLDGKAKVLVKGRGVQLDLAALPWSQPVVVQLKNSEGECWEARYDAPARRDQPGRFLDKGQ